MTGAKVKMKHSVVLNIIVGVASGAYIRSRATVRVNYGQFKLIQLWY
jgi:hypothetical protein